LTLINGLNAVRKQVLTDVIYGVKVGSRSTFRQAAQSRVITNAHRINQGQMPELIAPEGSDFFFVQADEPEDAARKLLAVVSSACRRASGSTRYATSRCCAR